MGNLFHDFTVAPDHPPHALVQVRSLQKWFETLKQRTVSVNGCSGQAKRGLVAFDLVPASVDTTPSWTVEKTDGGWIIGSGEVSLLENGSSGRVPEIDGIPLDFDPDNPPVLPDSDSGLGIIVVECNLHMDFSSAVPANGSAGTDYPPYSSTVTWNADPTIRWLADTSPTYISSFPPAGTSTDIVMQIPLAQIAAGGVVQRLRWADIILFPDYLVTVWPVNPRGL